MLWLLLPLIVGYFASFWFPAFVYFRFLYVLPAFYLLVAYAISTFKLKNIKLLVIILLIGVNFFGWITYVTDKTQQREQWRDAVKFIESNIKNNEVVIFEYPQPFTPYRWYSKGLIGEKGVTDSISANSPQTNEITRNTIEGKSGVYHFEYLRDLSDPQRFVETELISNGFRIEKEFSQFHGVGKITYWTKL